MFLLVRDHQPVGTGLRRILRAAASAGCNERALRMCDRRGSQREQLLPTRATLEHWPAPIATSTRRAASSMPSGCVTRA